MSDERFNDKATEFPSGLSHLRQDKKVCCQNTGSTRLLYNTILEICIYLNVSIYALVDPLLDLGKICIYLDES